MVTAYSIKNAADMFEPKLPAINLLRMAPAWVYYDKRNKFISTHKEETVKFREAKDEEERRLAALCSTTEDLHPDGKGRVLISGVLPSGDRILLGDISEDLFYLEGVDIWPVIEEVRFNK